MEEDFQKQNRCYCDLSIFHPQKVSKKDDGTEKREYPFDVTFPDINDGIYGTDEFRMYILKINPCFRAYPHNWAKCPFVHLGEPARRRDPRKYHYSCVPCPEFRKGSCQQGDACEYAHGIFERWLHPAEYRTRLCKDDSDCSRKVCFFAHKPEELRSFYASTGSAMGSSLIDPTLLSPTFDLSSRSGVVKCHTGFSDWAIELIKLRMSDSFGFRSNESRVDEPDVSWVQSLLNDPPDTIA